MAGVRKRLLRTWPSASRICRPTRLPGCSPCGTRSSQVMARRPSPKAHIWGCFALGPSLTGSLGVNPAPFGRRL